MRTKKVELSSWEAEGLELVLAWSQHGGPEER